MNCTAPSIAHDYIPDSSPTRSPAESDLDVAGVHLVASEILVDGEANILRLYLRTVPSAGHL
jgi:hypothetical protein